MVLSQFSVFLTLILTAILSTYMKMHNYKKLEFQFFISGVGVSVTLTTRMSPHVLG